MEKSLLKSSLREIKSSLGRYIAILLIVALGVGFFAGLMVSESAMLKTGDRYLAAQNYYDYRLLSTIGFEKALKQADEESASIMRQATGGGMPGLF